MANQHDCTTIAPMLSAYLDSALELSEQSTVEQVLRECSQCTAALGTLADTRSQLRSAAGQMDVPSGLMSRLKIALDSVDSESQIASKRPALRRLSWAGAMLMMLVVAAWAIMARIPNDIDLAGLAAIDANSSPAAPVATPEAAAAWGEEQLKTDIDPVSLTKGRFQPSRASIVTVDGSRGLQVRYDRGREQVWLYQFPETYRPIKGELTACVFGPPTVQHRTARGNVVAWAMGRNVYALVGGLDMREMEALVLEASKSCTP